MSNVQLKFFLKYLPINYKNEFDRNTINLADFTPYKILSKNIKKYQKYTNNAKKTLKNLVKMHIIPKRSL
jgi:glutamate 5-kinase